MSATLSDWLRLSHPLALLIIGATILILATFGFRKIFGKGNCCETKL